MKDNLSIIITMLVFVILIVIFPLYNYFERQDDMSYNLALKATTNFVDEVLESGYLTQEMYSKFVNELSNTGNIYDIQLEAHKKVLTSDNSGGFDEQYKIDYNKDIFETNNNATDIMAANIVKEDAYYLDEGDQFYVRMNNSNTTMAGAIFSTIVPTASKERISVNYGGVVKNQAWAKIDAKYYDIAGVVNNSPTVYLEKVSGVIPATKNIPSTGLKLYPSSTDYVSNIILSASGPTTSSWWNKLKTYTWTLDNVESNPKAINETFTIPALSSGDHVLKVVGKDELGNKTDETVINITVTTNISGGTQSGSFTNAQQLLLKDIPMFLNAYPKGYDLTIYLGNTGHAYSGDEVYILGSNCEEDLDLTVSDFSSTGTLNSKLSTISAEIIQHYTLGSYPSGVTRNITSRATYTYDGHDYTVFKVNLVCNNINSTNQYKRIIIYYKNQHSGCVLKIMDSNGNQLGGAYEYNITYGT